MTQASATEVQSMSIDHGPMAPTDTSLTARALLQPFRSGKTTNLVDAPLEIHALPTDEGTYYQAQFDISPLDARGLLRLLIAVAPASTRRFSLRQAVINDWNVVDQAAAGDTHAQRLVTLHAEHPELAEAWSTFMDSRPAFLETLTDQDGPYVHGKYPRAVPHAVWPAHTDTRSDLLTSTYGVKHFQSVGAMVALLADMGVENAETVVSAHLGDLMSSNRPEAGQIRNAKTIARRFASWGWFRRSDFLEKFLNTLPSQALDDAVANELQENYGTLIADDGVVHRYPLSVYPDDLQAAFDSNRQRVSVGSYEATEISVPRNDGRKERFIVPDSVSRILPPIRMLPALAWIKDKEGKREFVFGQRREVTDRYTLYYDGVLGVLALAACSPEVIKNWHETMEIKGRTQRIGPAQVPVRALMSSDLLDSRFIHLAEAHVSN